MHNDDQHKKVGPKKSQKRGFCFSNKKYTVRHEPPRATFNLEEDQRRWAAWLRELARI